MLVCGFLHLSKSIELSCTKNNNSVKDCDDGAGLTFTLLAKVSRKARGIQNIHAAVT